MDRDNSIDTNPRLLPVNLAAQLLPGTFEHAVDHRLDHAIDLSRFDARFRNDTTGAPAYPPAVLLAVVSGLDSDIAHIFAAVLAVCDQQGLIGREMFAIDGVKLPSNVSKRRSGKRADFERNVGRLIPCVRRRSATATPASASCKMATIWASLRSTCASHAPVDAPEVQR